MNAILSASQMHMGDSRSCRGRNSRICHHRCELTCSGSSSEPIRHRRLSLRNTQAAEPCSPPAKDHNWKHATLITQVYEPTTYVIKHDCVWKKRRHDIDYLATSDTELVKSSSAPNIQTFQDGGKRKQEIFYESQHICGNPYFEKGNNFLETDMYIKCDNGFLGLYQYVFKETRV